MPATFLLATDDPDLLRAWWVLVPAGCPIVALSELVEPTPIPPGVPVVVVIDEMAVERLPPQFARFPTVFVGEPQSAPYEQAKAEGRARLFLSYAESRHRLGEFLPLLEEIAEHGALIELHAERGRRAESSRPLPGRAQAWSDNLEVWDFLEGALENMASRERLLAEFRRAARQLLRSSYVLFFLREAGGFRSDRGEFSCPSDDPLITYLSTYPAVLDGAEWPGPADPQAELAVRHKLSAWSARLIVPIHDNGRLRGLIAFGVRDDGQPYDAGDRGRAIFIARLLRQFLLQSTQLKQLSEHYDRWRMGEKYLPSVLILGLDEAPPKQVPLAVRALIGEVRQNRETRRLIPGPSQSLRAGAGLLSENQGVWAFWEDASADVREAMQKQRSERLALLHDIALTLNHEIGNALVSLAALRHKPGSETNSPVLLAAIKRDIASLEAVNRHLASIPTFSEVNPEDADLGQLLLEVSRRTGVTSKVGPVPVVLSVAPKLIEFAIEAIVESIVENRQERGRSDLTIQLRTTGEGEYLMALISIKGPDLALEGILPAPEPGDAPSHGRIGVFVAKEIIRLHGGEIHSGPGMGGPEILISLRKW
jgi:hypothetical protein